MRIFIERLCLLAIIAATVPVSVAQNETATKYDVLALPAAKSHLADKSLIFSLMRNGKRVFASGHRGHILYSDDDGDSWTQAEVPVRSGILEVYFYNQELGWAVGHGGIILHSKDGGASWQKQFDGYRLGTEGLAFYRRLADQNPDEEKYQSLIGEMEYALEQGADKPFFLIYFVNQTQGYAAGAYGILVRTLDGGKTWMPAMHTSGNEDFYHLFDSFQMQDERQFIAGEAGLIFAAEAGQYNDQSDFIEGAVRKLETSPYEGSFFTGVSADNGNIVIAGLRGSAFVSEDFGQNWRAVSKQATGAINDSFKLQDGRIALVTMSGEVLISRDHGISFTDAGVTRRGPIFAVTEAAPGELLLGGPNGIRKAPIKN